MAEGRTHDEWGRASILMTLVANANRDPKKRPKPYEPGDFFAPFKQKRQVLKVSAADMKAALGFKKRK